MFDRRLLTTVSCPRKFKPSKATPIPATPIEALPKSFIVPRSIPFAKTILTRPSRPYVLNICPKEMEKRIYANLGQTEVSSFIQNSPLKSFAVVLVLGLILGHIVRKSFAK